MKTKFYALATILALALIGCDVESRTRSDADVLPRLLYRTATA